MSRMKQGEQGADPNGVVLYGNNIYRSASDLLLRGAVSIDVHRAGDDDETKVWGRDLWTGQDVRSALVSLVGSGMSLRAALERLQVEQGRMPSLHTIYTWLGRYPDFDEAYRAAKRQRGEVMAETALEVAIAVKDTDPAVAIKHLQWHSSKLNSDYRDTSAVEVNAKPVETLTDEQIDRRIAALLANPELAKTLPGPVIDVTPEA